MIGDPLPEDAHRAVDQGLAEGRQLIVDSRWRLRVGVPVDQAVGQQPMQRLRQRLVADTADRGAQVVATARTRSEGRKSDGIPPVGEEVRGCAQPAISNQFAVTCVVSAHAAIIAEPPRTDRCATESLTYRPDGRQVGEEATVRIGILGTGAMASALGAGWARAGHDVVVGGRSPERAHELSTRLGSGVRAAAPREVVSGRDAVLLAVSWNGVEDALQRSGAADGLLDGTALIDPTNAVEHGIGVLLTEGGHSMADRIAVLAPGAHVVKAFNLFPADQWTASAAAEEPPVTVPICADDPAALEIVSTLVSDVGGLPAVLGPLDRARQLEEVAGFVIALTFAGSDPNSAIPALTR